MKRCELLIPAGGKKQYIAAVENGADAIYVGGRDFNARMSAENFSLDELESALDYGHGRGVKTYITMNTLLDDSQLEHALSQAGRYYQMGADGVIIQDLGLGLLVKENFPKLPLHLSTQAGVYDAEGVKAAAKLGYERVVMARELSFDEIKKAIDTGVEIEVFVHGALCICYSGQCQLSRYIGGRSGNKGGCAQPCRLPYKGAAGEPYPLSPKDLCLIEEIGMLAGAGTASLKVEGRMKSPEYVATVTSIYRKYLDMWYEFGKYQVTEEDMNSLKQIFNRGGFTKGYFYGEPGQAVMSSKLSKNAGLFAGRAAKDSAGPLMEIREERKIQRGDYIEIRGKENSGNLVTYAENIGKGLIRFGDIKTRVSKGDEVYILTSGHLMDNARKTFENIEFDSGKYLRKTAVNMKVKASPGKAVELEVIYDDGKGLCLSVKKTGDILDKAKGDKGCKDVIIRQLSKTGATPFTAGTIDVSEEEPCYAPVSSINTLRREALTELEKKIKASYKRDCGCQKLSYNGSESFEFENQNKNSDGEREAELVFYDADDFLRCDIAAISDNIKNAAGSDIRIKALVPIHQYEKCLKKKSAKTPKYEIIPYIQGMNKGAGDRWIERHFREIVQLIKEHGGFVYVGNIRWIEPFAQTGIKVMGDSALNITNKYSEMAYRRLGMTQGRMSLEKEEKGMGAFPLMTTEHKFSTEFITDRKGYRYRLKFDDFSHKTLIIREEEPISWKRVKNVFEEGAGSVRIYIS